MDAHLSPQRLADGPGVNEADQVLGEDRRLRPGGQADRQPTGGDAAICSGSLAGLLLIPEEGSDQSIASSLIESLRSRSVPVLRMTRQADDYPLVSKPGLL